MQITSAVQTVANRAVEIVQNMARFEDWDSGNRIKRGWGKGAIEKRMSGPHVANTEVVDCRLVCDICDCGKKFPIFNDDLWYQIRE